MLVTLVTGETEQLGGLYKTAPRSALAPAPHRLTASRAVGRRGVAPSLGLRDGPRGLHRRAK